MSNWIKWKSDTNEPSVETDVLFVAHRNKQSFVCYGRRVIGPTGYECWHDLTERDRDGDPIDFGGGEVTHWMPLPELPD